MKVDTIAFEGPKNPYKGHTVKASYLKTPKGQSLVEIFKDSLLVRRFLFPSYKIWNIAAHFEDIVNGELEKAAWDGISGATVIINAAKEG